MGTQILGAIANILLDALFIAKMGMGVEGAALGTVLAQGASAACGLWFFYSGSSPLRIRLRFLVRLKMKVIRKICAVGSSPFVTELSFVFYMTLMNNMVKKYGGDIGLSAMGVFLSLDSILFLPALAIGEAVQPVIGYNYGAGKPDRVISAIKYAIYLVSSLYLLSFAVAETFAREMILLFNNDPELLAIGQDEDRLYRIVFGCDDSYQFGPSGPWKTREAITLSVFGMRSPLPSLIVLPRCFGLWGVWMSFPVGDICGCFVASFFLKRLFKWLEGDSALFIE